MRQRKQPRPELTPRPYDFSKRTAIRAQMVCLCVLAYDKGQLNVVKLAQQRYSPCGSAFGAWRQIPSLPCPRVTKSHRNNGDYFWIVEGVRANPHPLPQVIAARVIERNSTIVNSASGRLAGNKDAGTRVNLQNGARP